MLVALDEGRDELVGLQVLAHLDPGLHSLRSTLLYQSWTELVEQVGKGLEASPLFLFWQSEHLPCLLVQDTQSLREVGVLDAVSDDLLVV